MKLIIAGGREYELTENDICRSNEIVDVKEFVSGGAKGADTGGEIWADTVGLPVKRFPAEWSKYGKSAGIVRNREMVAYADAAVLFPGGSGTRSLFKLAKKAGLTVYDWRNN